MAAKTCPQCGRTDIRTRSADYETRFGNVSKQAGLLGNTIFLPLTALVAAVDNLTIYHCNSCGREWHY